MPGAGIGQHWRGTGSNGGERNRVVADIRYVIVWDLHFGAENSVLTTLNERPSGPAIIKASICPV